MKIEVDTREKRCDRTVCNREARVWVHIGWYTVHLCGQCAKEESC